MFEGNIVKKFFRPIFKKKAISPLVESFALRINEMGVGVCEIEGNLERVNAATGEVAEACKELDTISSRLGEHNRQMARTASLAQETGREAADRIERSSEELACSIEEVRELIRGTTEISARMNTLHEMLRRVAASAETITQFSRQTNLLSLNASIEAAKAGEAGRSFAVVASAVKQLAVQANAASQKIEATVDQLSREAKAMIEVGDVNARRATQVDKTVSEIDATIKATTEAISNLHGQAQLTASTARIVEQDCYTVCELIGSMATSTSSCRRQVDDTRAYLQRLLLVSDGLLGEVVTAGGSIADSLFIETARQAAHDVSEAFERALALGRINEERLFSAQYVLVDGSAPAQFVAPFTELCDEILPAIQDKALMVDGRIKICCAFDRHGYLPTHHARYSMTPSSDSVLICTES